MNTASTQPSLEPHQPPASAAANSSKGYNLDLVRSLRMHRVLAVSVAALVFVFMFAFGLSRRPYYETQALIYVQPMKTKLITDTGEGTYDSPRYETYIQQQLQTIIRSDILTEALDKPSARAWFFPGEPAQSAVARLQHSLKVDRVQGSYELSIDLSGSNPRAIAAVVNAVSNAYIRGERSDELAQSDQQLHILEDELQRVTTELVNARKEQADLSVSLGVADTSGDTADPFDVQLGELRSELAKATADSYVAAAQLASITTAPNATENLRAAADEIAATDPGLSSLKQTIGAERSTIASEMAGLTTINPLYRQDQDKLTRLASSLTEMESEVRVKAARQLELKLQLEARRTADIEARLSRQLEANTAIATHATPQLQRAADLTAGITRLQARYTEVDNAINAIELEKDTSGLVHVLVEAEAPLAPKTSTRNIILAAAFPLALLLGAAAAVVARKIDSRIYTGKDVAEILGFYPMAVLPSLAEVETAIRDEFVLRLVAGLDQVHRADGARTFILTAASPGEDITDLVASLALKMKHFGYGVVTLKSSELIEDSPLSKDLGGAAPPQPVISTAGGAQHDNLIVRTIAKIKISNDLLFIDALPLLSSAESEFAARLSDVVVLVAESGRTTHTEIASSLALVKRLRVPGVVTVLSDVRLRNADSEFISIVHSVERRLDR